MKAQRQFLSSLGVIVGCAANAPPMEPPKEAPPPLETASTARIGNAGWERLRPHFLGSGGSGGDVANLHSSVTVRSNTDPVEPHAARGIDLEDPIDIGCALRDPEPPLGDAPLADYRVTMVRWGSSAAKAVVVGPDGVSYLVERGTRFGASRVVDIREDALVVQEDHQSSPTVLSLATPLDPLLGGSVIEPLVFANEML
jgi:hypothetical protein